MAIKKIGILTGGGDCPGLNAVIRAVAAKAHHAGVEVIGLKKGWLGLVEGLTMPLSYSDVEEMHLVGGTMLLSSRTNPSKIKGGIEKCKETFTRLGLDALIAIGGEDTLGFAATLSKEGVPVVGVPKTIDNDLLGTEFTFGFDTAVSIATDALDRLRTTAKSHERTMVMEVMGRHAGWITAFSGIASGADVVITPEEPMPVAQVCDILNKQTERGKHHAVIAIAEGAEVADLGTVQKSHATDAFGHKQLGGIGEQLAAAIKDKTGRDTRSVTLGHVQRGGTPTATDRVLATSYGLKAMRLVLDGDFGKMVALDGFELTSVSLSVAQDGIKSVPDSVYQVAKHFFF